MEESRDDFLSYKIASVVFQEAIKAIPSMVTDTTVTIDPQYLCGSGLNTIWYSNVGTEC